MTAESLEFEFDKFLVHNGCDANAVICSEQDAHTRLLTQFCWNHNLQIFETFVGDIGEPNFVRV